MKKVFYLTAIAALSFAACTKEIASPDEAVQGQAPKEYNFFFSATAPAPQVEGDATKTTVNNITGVVEWEGNETIDVWYLDASNTPVKVEGTAISAGASTTFGITLPDGDNPDHFWAAYPAGRSELTAEDAFSITVKNTDGSFKAANYMAAYSTKEAKSFAFKNAVGIIRIALPSNGVISHNGTDYTVSAVRLRGKETAVQHKGAVTVTQEGGQVTGFSSDPVDGAANIQANLTDAVRADGYVYLPSYPGELTNGFSVRYFDSEGRNIPSAFTKDTPVTITRGKIKPLSDLTPYIVWDYYVSPDGTGDGKTEASPMSLADFQTLIQSGNNFVYCANRLNGATFHFKEGTYSIASDATLTFPAFKELTQIFLSGPGAILDGGEAASLLKFTGANLNIKFKGFTLQNGKAANGAAINVSVGTVTDENFIVDFEDCIIKDNTATATGGGGAILVATAVRNGQLRFNNCSFTGNSATSNSGVLYTNAGTMACLFNKCSFKGNTGASNAMQIYLNNASARLGMNNCTVNAGTSKVKNGSAVTCKGYSVIANSTIWSSSAGLGNWGQIALGCSIANNDPNGSRIVNCLVKNKDATYASFYLHADYNQYVDYCLYTPVKKSAEDINTYTIANSLEISDDEMGTKSEKSISHNNVSKIYYTFTADYSTNMTFATLDQVRTSIQSVTNVGPLLLSWLDTIPGALTTDITGYDRAANASHPGSWQKR